MAGKDKQERETGRVDPKEAADRSVDPDALLDGEDPRSRHPDDVRHWISAYSELIEYKERLLATSSRDRATMENPSARTETAEVDVPILRTELGRYRRRLDFWQRRNSELRTTGA
jgi:hypothetical protein